MKKGAKRNQIISELLHVTDEEFTDEELIHQLIATEVTKNADKDEHMTFGQRAADAVARFAGSWAFIFSFIAVMVIWMVINLVLGSRAFDEYPFILLISKQFLDLTLCNSANGGKACIYGLFRHLLYGRTIRI